MISIKSGSISPLRCEVPEGISSCENGYSLQSVVITSPLGCPLPSQFTARLPISSPIQSPLTLTLTLTPLISWVDPIPSEYPLYRTLISPSLSMDRSSRITGRSQLFFPSLLLNRYSLEISSLLSQIAVLWVISYLFFLVNSISI